jgi:hypothetical protein
MRLEQLQGFGAKPVLMSRATPDWTLKTARGKVKAGHYMHDTGRWF